MIKTKKINDLQQGDTIQRKDGGAVEIISNQKGLLFVYDQTSQIFKEINLTENAKNGDEVFIF